MRFSTTWWKSTSSWPIRSAISKRTTKFVSSSATPTVRMPSGPPRRCGTKPAPERQVEGAPMAQLSNDKLLVGTLPAEWQPLLELLVELDALVSLPKDGVSPTERKERARGLRARIVRQARRCAEELPPTLRATSPEYKHWFTEALLLWPFFADNGGAPFVVSDGGPPPPPPPPRLSSSP